MPSSMARDIKAIIMAHVVRKIQSLLRRSETWCHAHEDMLCNLVGSLDSSCSSYMERREVCMLYLSLINYMLCKLYPNLTPELILLFAQLGELAQSSCLIACKLLQIPRITAIHLQINTKKKTRKNQKKDMTHQYFRRQDK